MSETVTTDNARQALIRHYQKSLAEALCVMKVIAPGSPDSFMLDVSYFESLFSYFLDPENTGIFETLMNETWPAVVEVAKAGIEAQGNTE